jgi:hypothetical protein
MTRRITEVIDPTCATIHTVRPTTQQEQHDKENNKDQQKPIRLCKECGGSNIGMCLQDAEENATNYFLKEASFAFTVVSNLLIVLAQQHSLSNLWKKAHLNRQTQPLLQTQHKRKQFQSQFLTIIMIMSPPQQVHRQCQLVVVHNAKKQS